jgi:hypothetical protein
LILYLTCVPLQISTLPPSELGTIIRYPWLKELTNDEEETSPSPTRRHASPMAELKKSL